MTTPVAEASAGASSSLRVMLVNGNFDDGTVGGTQTFTRNLADWLIAAGHQVAVLCQGEQDRRQTADGIDVFRVRPPHLAMSPEPRWAHLVNQSLAIHNPVIATKVREAVRRYRPDVVHVQMLRRLTPAVLAALRHYTGAVVQTVHEPFSLWNFNAYLRHDSPDKLYTRRPCVVGLLKWRHRLLSRAVDHVCAPSHHALEPYLHDGYFDGVLSTVIANAVPFEWGDPTLAAAQRRTARTGGAGVTSFVFLGRLDHYKGVETLLRAFESLRAPDVALHVAGDGVLAGTVSRAAEHDRRITFHGPVHGAQRRDLLRDADVLVCPSTWSEPFGLVVLEAYAAGLPVVASRAGALPEIVDDGSTGLLVETGSASSLTDAMRRLREPGLRHELGERAANKAGAFHPDEFLRRQLAIYHTALARCRATKGGRGRVE